MVISTNSTPDGKPVFIVDPCAVLLETKPGDVEFTVFAQQRLKKRGLPLKQNYMDTRDDVLYCETNDRYVLLHEDNGILVLRKGKRTASHMKAIGNLAALLDDIEAGKASPIVDGIIKHYAPWSERKRKGNQVVEGTKQRRTDFIEGVSGNTSSVVSLMKVISHPKTYTVPVGHAAT